MNNQSGTTMDTSTDEHLDGRFEALKHRAIDAKDVAMTRGSALIARASDTIRANPLAAVGIAFGLGYLGMRLLRR